MKTLNLSWKKINGITLKQYIESPQFSIGNFLSIIIQLCLALEMAQEHFCFVHNDLTPWNIMIRTYDESQTINYLIGNKGFVIKSKIIPIIIDYGKSHVVYNNNHHGFINPFKASTAQDIIILLNTSVYEILTKRKNDLSSKHIGTLVTLMNFISGTTYRPQKFTYNERTRYTDAENFLRDRTKYSDLVSSNKYELENRTPLDLVNYIEATCGYRFPQKTYQQGLLSTYWKSQASF